MVGRRSRKSAQNENVKERRDNPTVEQYLKKCKEIQVKEEQKEGVMKIKILAAKDKNTTGYEKDMEALHALTFDLRHESIKKLKLSVKHTLQLYPGLRDYKEAAKEFGRIHEIDVKVFEKIFRKLLLEYHNRHVGSFICSESFCNEAAHILLKANVDKVKQEAALCMIFGCEVTEGKLWGHHFQHLGESDKWRGSRQQPAVIVNVSPFNNCAEIYAEKVKLMDQLNILDALLKSFYLHFVFNFEYTQNDKKLFAPFEMIVKQMKEKQQ